MSNPERKPHYMCRCCHWYSERKNLCPTCAAGCAMATTTRLLKDLQEHGYPDGSK